MAKGLKERTELLEREALRSLRSPAALGSRTSPCPPCEGSEGGLLNLTNIHGLPAPLVRAIRNDPYKGGGDISVTKLIDSPHRQKLRKQFAEFIVEDVSDVLFRLFGQGVHAALERSDDQAIVEERLFMEVDGWTLSGAFDRLYTAQALLQDYKVTSVFKAGGSDDWTKQMNVLRQLCLANGHKVDRMEIVAIFRDFKKSEAKRKENYPQAGAQVIPVEIWDDDRAMAFIRERIAAHKAAANGPSSCSDEERWASPTTYALMKIGAKRATKVAETPAQLGPVPTGFTIEVRPGSDRRCEDFCEVSNFCEQFKSKQKDNK